MKYIMIYLVKFYQTCISPLKSPCCRFYPTCSSYAVEAFQKRGFFVGLYLTVRRILRCNPFCRGGVDPVPEKRHGRQATKSVIQSKIYRAGYHQPKGMDNC